MTAETLTEDECAELLGVSRSTLRRMREQGIAPPHYKTGTGPKAHTRYQRAAVLDWITNGGQQQ